MNYASFAFGVYVSLQIMTGALMAEDTAREVAEKAFAAQRRFDLCEFRAKGDISSTHTKPQSSTLWLRRKKDLFDCEGSYLYEGEAAKKSFTFRKIVKDGKFVNYQRPIQAESKSIPSGAFDNSSGFFLFGGVPHYGGFLEGYFDDDRRLLDLLLEDGKFQFLENETVGDLACRVVEAENAAYKAKLWISPDQGFNVVQLLLETAEEKGRKFSMTDVLLGESNGVKFCQSGKLKITSKSGKDEQSYSVSREGVSFDPNFDGPPVAFEMSMPEGTIVFDWDKPDSGLRYVWKDGKIVPAGGEFAKRADGSFAFSPRMMLFLVSGIGMMFFAFRLMRK